MVYDMHDGGVFHRFLSAAKAGQRIEIWGSEATRWPLIESSDLARAYCDLVDCPNLVGHFNAVAEEGVNVGNIASVISEAYGSPREPIIRTVDEAKGPTLDQQMSARKLRSAVGWQPQITDFAELTSQSIADIHLQAKFV